MEHSIPANLQPYLDPIINRISALELKNQHLEQELSKVLSHLSLKNENKPSSNKQTVNHKTTVQTTVTKPIKAECQVVKKPTLTIQEQKIQTEPKEDKKLTTTNKITKPLPKKQERERITSIKGGNVQQKLSTKDLKKPNGPTTPTGNKKITINEKKTQEQKTQVIVQVLDLVEEDVPEKQKCEQTVQKTQQKVITKIEQVKQKQQVKHEENKGKLKPSTSTKQTVITGKQKTQQRVSGNQNKLSSNKKIQGQDEQKTIKNNSKVGSKQQINTKSTKALKQNNKATGPINSKKQIEGSNEEQVKKQTL